MTDTKQDLTKEIATVAKDITYPAYGGIMYPSDSVLAQKGIGRGLAIYDDLERDAWVYACMHKRKMAVIARPWIVDAASSSRLDKKAADMVRAHIDAMGFDPASYHLLDAILKGRSACEIMWERDGNELRPVKLLPRDARRFTFADDYSLRLLTPSDPLRGEPVPDKKFIVHAVGSKDGNPHGLGLGQKLWWPVFFKRQGISFWLQFLDKFGAPTAVAEYADNVNRQEVEDALRRIAHDAGIAVPTGTVVKLLEAARSGTGTHDNLVRYMDEQIASAILMEGGGKGNGGELAAASILRNELRIELIKADADLLSATLQETLVAWIVELNMPGAKPPRVWREVTEETDLKAMAERDKLLVEMGFVPSEDYVRETYGGDWTFRGPSAALPQAGQPPSPAFAEGETAEAPDQAALDQALDDIPPAVMQAQMEQMLDKLLSALEKADGFDAAMKLLENAYPGMATDKLETLLSQVIFTGELHGYDSNGTAA